MTSSYDSALVDTALIEDARLLRLPRGIRLLHLEAIVWCKARRTDGAIQPRAAVRRMTDEDDPEAAAEALVAAGLWAETEDGWQLSDYRKTQMDREHVERRIENAKKARDRYEERHPDRPRRGRTDTSRETSDDVSASQPARPQGKGRLVDAPSGHLSADAGRPTGAPVECSECSRQLSNDRGYGTPKKPLCWDCSQPESATLRVVE